MNNKRAGLGADLYLRLSDARNEKGSFADREKKLRELAERLGLPVSRVVIENDVREDGTPKPASAFKRRKVVRPNGETKMRVYRPGFRSILDDLTHGRAKALLAEDLDRAMRDPRDLEDLIDVIEDKNAMADSLSGSLRFSEGGTDAEITQARVMVAIANKFSRDMTRRITAARERRATNGENGGGIRPFGFGTPKVDEKTGEPVVGKDGKPVLDYLKVVPREASVIKAMGRAVMFNEDGMALRQIARDLRNRRKPVPSVSGKPWTPEMVRSILLRPRNAGLMVYKGEVIGKAPWEPIIPQHEWEAIVAKLTNPDRNVTPGPAPKYLGSGLYLCACGTSMEVHTKARQEGRARVYRCREMEGEGPHSARSAALLDDHVEGLIVAWVSRPGAIDLVISSTPEVDVVALNRTVRSLQEKLDQYARDEADDLITRAQMLASTKRTRTRIAEVQQQLAAATAASTPLAELVIKAEGNVKKAKAAWDEYPLGIRRAILDELMTVQVGPSKRGRGFDSDSVTVTEKK